MENQEWDFGSMQAKVKAENGTLTWKLIGNGSSSYPLRSVTGIQYEKGGMLAWMSNIIVLASGSESKKIQVPKSENSEKLVEAINLYIARYHDKQKAQPAPGVSFSLADELSKLASLKQQGFLSEQEFNEQKQKLLTR